MVRTVLSELGGFKFRVFLPIPLFIFLMNWYHRMKGVVELPITGEAGPGVSRNRIQRQCLGRAIYYVLT